MRYDLCTCIYIITYVVIYDDPFATSVTDATVASTHVECPIVGLSY